ncbi:unnamed protein product [Blepharisma stoltei]|uniref:Uncharacterized protein n=1 Tax=Blepharisma stoltei TaxID=1481888 RepID=A0AAU9IC07_9CILI|nr:unnamed protein product [Blepharisma stoltei]
MTQPIFRYDEANWINDILFTWAFSPIRFWVKNKPNPSNLVDVPKRLKFNESVDKLEKEWENELNSKNPSFFKALIRVVGWDFIKYCIPGIIGYNLGLVQAVLVIFLVEYMRDEDADHYEAIYLVIAYATSVISAHFLFTISSFKLRVLTARIKSIIPCVIFKKVLTMSNVAISEGDNKGKLSNVIATELEFLDLLFVTMLVLAMPIFIIGSYIILGILIGWAGIIGLTIDILHFPIIVLLANIVGNYRLKIAIHSDGRVKMITNLIEGIRIIKLYGWEDPYLALIYKKRLEEIREAIHKINVFSIGNTIGTAGSCLILLITFWLFVHFGNDLSSGEVFCAATLLLMAHVLITRSGVVAITTIVLLILSMQRVTQIILLKPRPKSQNSDTMGHSVSVKNASFGYNGANTGNSSELHKLSEGDGEKEPALIGINFELEIGELLIVVGPSGSGKSTLLMGLLQEIALKSGNFGVNGKIAYSGDNPWIVSGTIKENIVMGSEYNEELYNRVIFACALEKDLKLLTYGDNTNIGNRGITLSGGQKARICLARAVYTNRDIILLDDPLSSFDPEVSAHIWKYCIKGILSGKTIVIATHQLQLASKADKILILFQGRQIFFGNSEELKTRENIVNILGDLNDTSSVSTIKNSDLDSLISANVNQDKISIEDEASSKPVVVKSYFRYLLYGYKYSFIFVIIFLILIAAHAASVAVMWWLAIWAAQSESEQENNYYVYVFAIISLLSLITAFLRCYILYYGMAISGRNLHNAALAGITKTNTWYFDKNPTGRMINRFSKDTLLMDEILMMHLFEFVHTLILLWGTFIVVTIVAPLNVFAITAYLVYVIFLALKLVPISKELRSIELMSKSPIFSICNESVLGLVYIRSFDLQEKFYLDLRKAVEHNLKCILNNELCIRFYQAYIELGGTLLNIINVIILVVFRDYVREEFAAMSMSLLISILALASWWAEMMIETENLMSSPQRLMEYADLPVEGNFDSSKKFVIHSGKIEVQNLWMRYQDNLPFALQYLDFYIEPAQKVGIVGRTGSGKSSFMQVLFRLINPYSGTIIIDGQDYREAGLHQLRKQMSVIPQSPTIFLASFRDNLDPFHEHTEEEIMQVLKETRLYDKINSYPDGLNHILNGDGGGLSAGQKQLVCLARAVIRKNKIVMMDEATSNVDFETDKFIHKKIKKMFVDSTLLIIAHRLRTIIDMEKIIVMEEGTCKEFGDPKELVKNEDSLFRKMIMYTGQVESQYLLKKLIID